MITFNKSSAPFYISEKDLFSLRRLYLNTTAMSPRVELFLFNIQMFTKQIFCGEKFPEFHSNIIQSDFNEAFTVKDFFVVLFCLNSYNNLMRLEDLLNVYEVNKDYSDSPSNFLKGVYNELFSLNVNLKPGDKVKILAQCPPFYAGFSYTWCTDMDNMVGKKHIVIMISKRTISIGEYAYIFPFFILRKE